MSRRRWGFALAVAALAATVVACSVTFPLVGRYEDGAETFRGVIDSNLAGSAHIQATSSTGARCTGESWITYKPAYSVVVPCVGQRGSAVLDCSDGRRVRGEWVATGCTSGYGEGYDQDGRRFLFAMGMSLEEAARRRSETSPPAPPNTDTASAARAAPGADAPQQRIRGNGTGFFVAEDGYLVTSAHVARGDRRVSVLLQGRELPVTVVDTDSANDLALLKVAARGVPIPITATPPAKGEDAGALGYPAASSLGTELKATFGKINALSGPRDDPRWLQTDTPVQPGSSGGPLLNMRGEVVGIITASFSTAANVRRIGGAIPQNVNYAIKAQYLVALLDKTIPGKWRRAGSVRFASTAELVRQRERSVVLITVR
jgi:S1-C subfamily serine protease